MTNEEFKAKWERQINLIPGVNASYNGKDIILKFKDDNDGSIVSIYLSPPLLEQLKFYEEDLRKDIRRVMKLGEFSATDKWYKEAADSETGVPAISAGSQND